jgi:hypothetical protein
VPSEAPIRSTRSTPTVVRPPLSRACAAPFQCRLPLAPVPIAAFFPEVTPNEAPPLTEVPPDVTPAAPIEVLPTFDTNDNPMPRQKVPSVFEPTEAVVPRQNIHPPEGSHAARVELDHLVQRSIKAYESTTTWGEFVAQCRDPTGDFHPDVKHLPHRDAHLLDTLRRSGATVGMKTEPWSRQRKDKALKRGSHQSAMLHTDFLCDEFVDMIHKGQWVLLPARLVMDENILRLSPLGVVPQRDCRPRTICDYSFFFVNLDTIPLAPPESMQFGRALWWILQQVSDADPRLGPVHLSKIDIADGFYRIWINAEDVPKLGVMFPSKWEPLVGFPLVLPMGWMQPPPLFTAATETVADLANHNMRDKLSSSPHRLDDLSETPPPVVPNVPRASSG